MNNGKSKNSSVVLVVFTLIIVVLIGYIIYDKVANPSTKCNVGETTKEVTDNNETTKCPDCNCQTSNKNNLGVRYFSGVSKNSQVHLALFGESKFFSITNISAMEMNNDIIGGYSIEGGKLILFLDGAIDTTNGYAKYLLSDLGISFTKSDSYTVDSYSLDYNENELQLGNVKLYAVN